MLLKKALADPKLVEIVKTAPLNKDGKVNLRESGWGHWWQERSILFCADREDDYLSPRKVGGKFCMEILNALIETAEPQGDMDLLNNLIQLLEEKFGLKVEVCGNCNFCHLNLGKYYCEYNFSGKSIGQNIFDTCPYKSWVPKEISEKPSSA